MNRAAEYLVLRMLFLSGHQVMHTETPGVSSVQSEQPQAQAQPQQALVGRGSAGSIVTEMGSMVDVGGINNVSDGTGGGKNQKEEDTAATSTGTGNMSVAQPEDRNMIDVVAASSDMVADKEEKVEDGT